MTSATNRDVTPPQLIGDPKQTGTIVVDYELPKRPALVWRALTDSKLIAAWLMSNDFEAKVGHHFTFQAQPVPGWDGVVHCEVLALEPEKKLVYSWKGGDASRTDYGAPLDTTVTWTLQPKADGGTLLRLEHAGFKPANAFAFDNMGKGWRSKLAERIAQAIDALG